MCFYCWKKSITLSNLINYGMSLFDFITTMKICYGDVYSLYFYASTSFTPVCSIASPH